MLNPGFFSRSPTLLRSAALPAAVLARAFMSSVARSFHLLKLLTKHRLATRSIIGMMWRRNDGVASGSSARHQSPRWMVHHAGVLPRQGHGRGDRHVGDIVVPPVIVAVVGQRLAWRHGRARAAAAEHDEPTLGIGAQFAEIDPCAEELVVERLRACWLLPEIVTGWRLRMIRLLRAATSVLRGIAG